VFYRFADWLAHPSGLNTRVVEAGDFASLPAGRRGRRTNSPPQLGQVPPKGPSAHATQKVHSNEQMRASRDSGGRSLLQHSQLGRRSSIVLLLKWGYFGLKAGNWVKKTMK
jgi:hypothetical protein